MATRGPLGRGKRERERARVERQKAKVVRREEAKQRRGQGGAPLEPGVDPDIAGIVPGPQANPWLDELEPDGDSTTSDDEGRE